MVSKFRNVRNRHQVPRTPSPAPSDDRSGSPSFPSSIGEMLQTIPSRSTFQPPQSEDEQSEDKSSRSLNLQPRGNPRESGSIRRQEATSSIQRQTDHTVTSRPGGPGTSLATPPGNRTAPRHGLVTPQSMPPRRTVPTKRPQAGKQRNL